MFKRKECQNCRKKISSSYDFCPYCGNSLTGKKRKEDFGMLGRDDRIDRIEDEFERFTKSVFGGIGGNMIGKMLGSAIKILEKEMEKEMKRKNPSYNHPKTNFQLFINGKKLNIGEEGSNPFLQKSAKRKVKKVRLNQFSEENLKKFLSLPREEPSTNIRRLSNKVVYEINIPEVESIEDISITPLESSIEVKAIGKSKSYFKLIPINLPIKVCKLLKEKLVLEFGMRSP